MNVLRQSTQRWLKGQPRNRNGRRKLPRDDMPFFVKAIQVDGGSDFMAEFEIACQARGVAFYVLPPRSPQMNGAVERCNGAWRYEFYETYELPTNVEKLDPSLDSYQHLYKSPQSPRSPYRQDARSVSSTSISIGDHPVPYVLNLDIGLPKPPNSGKVRRRVTAQRSELC